MVPIFLDFDEVATWVQIKGVVGGCCKLVIDVDLGSSGEGGGSQESRTFDCASASRAIALGEADHKKGADPDEKEGG